jgi:hypothetical protein
MVKNAVAQSPTGQLHTLLPNPVLRLQAVNKFLGRNEVVSRALRQSIFRNRSLTCNSAVVAVSTSTSGRDDSGTYCYIGSASFICKDARKKACPRFVTLLQVVHKRRL